MKSKTFRCAVVVIATLIGGLSVSACKTALESIPSASESGAQYYLPKALVRLKILKNKSANIFAMRYIETILVADRDFGYTLNYNASSFSHDHLVIDITSSVLLDKVEFTADEKTGEFIIKFMEFGKAIQKSTFTPFAILEDDDDVEVVYDGFISPFYSNERKIITDRINALAVGGPRFSFEFDDDSAVGSLTAMGLDGINELVQDIVDSEEKLYCFQQ